MTKLKAYLGPPSKLNTYKAELIGAMLAIWIISNCPETVGKKVTLYIDNQSVVNSFVNPKATSGQYLARHLNFVANELTCYLDIRWISSHSKVRGNEKADELAKEAANGWSDSRVNLPPMLRNPLPTSASMTKQVYHNGLKEKWVALWEASDRSQRLLLAEDTVRDKTVAMFLELLLIT